MTSSDDVSATGSGGDAHANGTTASGYGLGDRHSSYRQQASAHFGKIHGQDGQLNQHDPAGGGPYQSRRPTSSPYPPPPIPPATAPPNSAPPLNYSVPPAPPSGYGTPPQPSYYQSQPLPALPVIWQRLTGAIDRLLVRGANGELLRQPWFDSIRAQSADNFVFLSYGGAFVFGLILALATSSTVVKLLLCVLWASLGYLYIALSTRLARQFLE